MNDIKPEEAATLLKSFIKQLKDLQIEIQKINIKVDTLDKYVSALRDEKNI